MSSREFICTKPLDTLPTLTIPLWTPQSTPSLIHSSSSPIYSTRSALSSVESVKVPEHSLKTSWSKTSLVTPNCPSFPTEKSTRKVSLAFQTTSYQSHMVYICYRLTTLGTIAHDDDWNHCRSPNHRQVVTFRKFPTNLRYVPFPLLHMFTLEFAPNILPVCYRYHYDQNELSLVVFGPDTKNLPFQRSRSKPRWSRCQSSFPDESQQPGMSQLPQVSTLLLYQLFPIEWRQTYRLSTGRLFSIAKSRLHRQFPQITQVHTLWSR